MSSALLAARLFLALVFVVAGLSKLADLPGSQQAVRAFGAPVALATPLGLLLPLAELGIAIALIPTQSARGASIAALSVLLAFIVGISFNLAQGRRPDCHCFGQVYSRPIGIETLGRNALLAAVAAFIVWRGASGASATGWLSGLSPAAGVALALAVTALALIAVQSWYLLHLTRMNGRLLLRIETLEGSDQSAVSESTGALAGQTFGLAVGAEAPAFALLGLDGEVVSLDSVRARGMPVMLLFTSPSCNPCSLLLPEIGRWQAERQDVTVALVSNGTREENRAKCAEHGVSTVLLQAGNEVAEAYLSPGTPSAVIVSPEGTVASPLALGADAIRDLVSRVGEQPAARENVQIVPLLDRVAPRSLPSYVASRPIGQVAPPIALPDLNGRLVDLADFRGHETAIVFWNTECGFCQSMLPDLEAWDRARTEDAPKLIVVSSGSDAGIRAMKLQSPVVLDPDSSIARRYGAGGTPTGVLLDDRGQVASPVVAGAEAVLTLLAWDKLPTLR